MTQKTWNKVLIAKDERLDDLGRKGLMLIQNPGYFCFGTDAVLLSDYAKVKPGDRVLDLCTGNGIIPVLLYGKTEASEIVGLEIQKALCDMANRSVLGNGIESKVKIIEGDLREIEEIFPKDSFNVVTVNPPYMADSAGLHNESESVYIARHEVKCTIEEVVRAASYVLCPKGRMFMIHRPLRLVDIFASMRKYKIEPKSMRLVAPFEGKEPNLVLIEGIKGGNPELRIAPTLFVYTSQGQYSSEVMEIYGHEK